MYFNKKKKKTSKKTPERKIFAPLEREGGTHAVCINDFYFRINEILLNGDILLQKPVCLAGQLAGLGLVAMVAAVLNMEKRSPLWDCVRHQAPSARPGLVRSG